MEEITLQMVYLTQYTDLIKTSFTLRIPYILWYTCNCSVIYVDTYGLSYRNFKETHNNQQLCRYPAPYQILATSNNKQGHNKIHSCPPPPLRVGFSKPTFTKLKTDIINCLGKILYTILSQIRPEMQKTREHFHLHPTIWYHLHWTDFLKTLNCSVALHGDIPQWVAHTSVKKYGNYG
jgi:hypothetical protein